MDVINVVIYQSKSFKQPSLLNVIAVFQSSSNCQCGSQGVMLSTEHSMQLIINSLRSCELCQHIVTASMSCSLLPAPCFLPPAPFTVFCALWGHLKADIKGAEVWHRIKLVTQLPVRNSGRIKSLTPMCNGHEGRFCQVIEEMIHMMSMLNPTVIHDPGEYKSI